MNIKRLILPFFIVAVPTTYALLVRVLFEIDHMNEMFGVMTATFLFLSPGIVGALTMYISSVESSDNVPYRIFMPWIPVFVFMAVTLLLSMEGWACWVMALPLFLVFSSVGGILGTFLKRRQSGGSTYLSVLVLLPFLIAPIENTIGPRESTYTADTHIDIEARAATIWANVTRVQEIAAEQDKGWLTRNLGFPRPVKAELDFAGVGGAREAIFTNGLVFHETVTEYVDQKKMVFSIKAFPHEIPSTTMDEHVVIGGEYFDVIDGTYELEQLNATTQRLHLYSHFKLKTTFNFYASWWARWIMQDIQNNILQIEKHRAEGK